MSKYILHSIEKDCKTGNQKISYQLLKNFLISDDTFSFTQNIHSVLDKWIPK
jgi:hypothetical protein